MSARLQVIRNNFNGGEISQLALGRSDLEKYRNCCERMENVIPLVAGGFTRRPGTRYIVPAMGPSRLVSFVFSIEQSYVLEFGNKKLRFYTNGGQVQSGAAAYEIDTPYDTSVDDLWDLKFAHKADVTYIVHPNHPPYKLSRVANTNWLLFAPAFASPPLYAFDQDIGSANADHAAAITLTPAATSGTDVNFTASAGVFIDGDIGKKIIAGAGAAIITGYGAGDVTSADAGTGATLHTQVTADILNPFASTAAIAAGSWLMRGAPQSYACFGNISSSNFFATNKLGPGQTQDLYAFQKYPTNQNAPTYQDTFRKIDIGRYAVLGGAVALITALTDSKHVSARTYSAITQTMANPNGNGNIIMAAASGGAWSLQDPAFSAANGYPVAVCFFQDRLMFAGTAALPQNVWGSVTGDYENFAVGAQDSNGLAFGINSGSLETIKSIEEFRGNLAVLTATAEYIIGGGQVQIGGSASALTPSDINSVRQSRYGADRIQPVVVDEDLIYVRRNKLFANAMSFDIQESVFSSRDLNILHTLITATGFKEMVYQQFPWRTIWFTGLDGNLVGLTFQRDQDVWGWHRQFTGIFGSDGVSTDQVGSIAVIPDPSGTTDQHWWCCKRTLGGVTVYTIELQDVALYVDCATQGVEDPKISEVTGLGYLQARQVIGNGDGSVEPPATIDATGTYELEKGTTAADVQVGLPFTSTVQTVRPELPLGGGTIMGLLKRWAQIWVRLYQSVNALIDSQRLPFRTPSMNMGQAVPPFTGDKQLEGNTEYDRDGRVLIQQDQPLPLTVLAQFGTMSLGEN